MVEGFSVVVVMLLVEIDREDGEIFVCSKDDEEETVTSVENWDEEVVASVEDGGEEVVASIEGDDDEMVASIEDDDT